MEMVLITLIDHCIIIIYNTESPVSTYVVLIVHVRGFEILINY